MHTDDGRSTEKAATISGYVEEKVASASTESQLKCAQVESEFLKQELVRAQIEAVRAETRRRELENTERQIEIQK